MYSQAHFTDEDRAVLCDGCEIECKFNKNGGTNDKQGILDEIKSLAMQHSGLTEFNSGYKNAVNDIISLIAPIFEEPRFKYNENGYSRFENKLIEFRNNTPLISVNYRQGKGVGIIKRYAYELLKIAEESIIKEPASEMWHDNKEMPSDKRILAIDCNGIPYVGYSGGINPNMVDRWVNFDNFINFANSVAKIKEKSVSKDLDKEFNRYLDDVEGMPRMWHPNEQLEWGKDIARHFANWQKENDIDEIRIIRELLENFDKTCDEYHDAGFKHGQEALMKDAVDGYVYYDYTDDRDREMLEVRADEISAEKYNITDGDKVKVIIIKKS